MKHVLGLAVVAGVIATAGCISDPTRVKADMEALVAQNRFDDARNYPVKRNPGGIPKTNEEKIHDDLVLTLVNPSEAQFVATRIKALRDIVLADLKKGDDAAARKHIYEFGTIVGKKGEWHPQPTANGLIYAAKIGLLNSRVNPAAYKRLKGASEKKIAEAIASGDFQKASDLIGNLLPVPAYPDGVDPLLDKASEEAIRQRCEKVGVEQLIASVKSVLYKRLAFREGYEKTDFVPDWSSVESNLITIRDALVNDDMALADANALIRNLLDGIKALFDDDATGENLTTAQLNDLLASLRADQRSRVNAAIEAKLAKAAADEAARLRKTQLAIAVQALSEVDVQSRIAAFTAAICDRTEPDINRILGDGARVLRLCAAGRPVSAADATSLLVAATYMDFADVAQLALANKADINGVSAKDSVGRTPYLVSLQFGTGAKLSDILASANRAVRDARGYGAIHYAVRYADNTGLMSAIDLGLDAKTAAKDGVTPLMVAAQLNNLPAVQALAPLSDVNAADAKGYSALLYAARIGCLPVVKALLGANADLKAKSKDGDTALDLAVMLPAENLIDYLLDEKKVAPTERAVSWCVINGKVLPLAKLVAHGGTVTDKHLAAGVKCGHLDMVKYLVSIGCDVNAESVKTVVRELRSKADPASTVANEIRAKGVASELGDIVDYLYAQGYRD